MTPPPVVTEACYCGARWTVRPDGIRVCPHCDNPPPVRRHVGWSDGKPIYGYHCPHPCERCNTVNRRRWDL